MKLAGLFCLTSALLLHLLSSPVAAPLAQHPFVCSLPSPFCPFGSIHFFLAFEILPFGPLLFRDLLSIPAIIFRFMDQYEGQVTPWWPSDERPQSCPTVATASESL